MLVLLSPKIYDYTGPEWDPSSEPVALEGETQCDPNGSSKKASFKGKHSIIHDLRADLARDMLHGPSDL